MALRGLFDKRPSVRNNSFYQQYCRELSWPSLKSTMFLSKHLVVFSVSCLGWFFPSSALLQHKPLQSCFYGLDVWFVVPGETALGVPLVN